MAKRVLAVASGGGHWEQLSIISRGFAGQDVVYATTIPGLPEKSNLSPSYIVKDANRNRPLDMLICAVELTSIIARHKPHVVVSTGAAPGLLALGIGKIFGAKAIWIDSVANSEKLSMSGKIAGKFADLLLTQWEHLSGSNNAKYLGSVL
jgi:UDP-N-acetylglucosamine:LPS N-acetylglucosamine transferase